MIRNCWGIAALCAAGALALFAADGKLSRDEAKKLKDPVAYSQKSIDRGKSLFLQNCTGCHGTDGKAEASIIADATDLTSPKNFKSGATEGEIFRSIRDGAGDQMPPFRTQLDGDEDIWNLVNFIHSLWPESDRPKLGAK